MMLNNDGKYGMRSRGELIHHGTGSCAVVASLYEKGNHLVDTFSFLFNHVDQTD
jgi:hypothetical protein